MSFHIFDLQKLRIARRNGARFGGCGIYRAEQERGHAPHPINLQEEIEETDMISLHDQSISFDRYGDMIFFETDMTDKGLLMRILPLVVVSFVHMNILEQEKSVIDWIKVAADVATGPSRTLPDDTEAPLWNP